MPDSERAAVARQVFERALAAYVPAREECAGAREHYESALRQLAAAQDRTDAQFDAIFEARERLATAQRNLAIQQAHFDGAEAEFRRATGRAAIPATTHPE